MKLGLDYSFFIIVYLIPLLGSKSCQNCKGEKCDARGICTEGCKAGYTDKYCQHQCQKTCVSSTCEVDPDSGKTVCSDGCEHGYCGPRCKIPCPDGCLACDWHHCENCTLCRADLYGHKCEHSCLQKCNGFACSVDGTCLDGCVAGRYGAHCNMSCISTFQSCHRSTGQCQQCQLGHFGDICQHMCPSCLTAEEEKLYTCRSGCKVCRSPYHPEPKQRSYPKQTECQDRQEKLLTAILTTVLLILIIIIIVFIFVACRNGFRSTRGKRAPDTNIEMKRRIRASSDPGEMEPLLKTKEQTCARCGRLIYQDLLVSCWKGNLAEMKRILDTGWGDVNCRGEVGRTLVMTAARRGHKDVLEFLGSQGTDVSLVDEEGNTTLHYACAGGDRETVEFVLSLGRTVINSRGGRGRTPVMDAACEGHRDVVDFLVSKGADVSLTDDVGNNILHHACVRGDRKTVEFILSLRVLDINCRGVERRTPLMEAAGRGHRGLVEVLVSHDADVSLADGVGNNTLHWACQGGDRATVEFVLSLGRVDVNARNIYGETAADVARGKGHHQLIVIVVQVY